MIFKKKKIDTDVKKLCELSGMEPEKAEKMLEKAKALGFTPKSYFRHEGWKLSEEELKELAAKREERNRKKEEAIKSVMDASGMERTQAINGIKAAKDNGISTSQYIRKHGYDLSESELAELGDALKIFREKRQERYDYYISAVCQKSGWDRETAIEKMNEAKEMGISYLKFVQTACWKNDLSKMEIIAESVIDRKKIITENKNFYIKTIMEATGWSYGKTELEVLKAKNLCECSYEDYCLFKFYELTPEEQEKYVTLGLFNKMRIKYNDHDIAATYFIDKAMFNKTFSEFIHRKWMVNTDENLTFEQFKNSIEGLSSVLIKPLRLTQGKGIEKFSCNNSEEENRALYENFISMDKSIMEEYIVQHHDMASFCPSSVNTLRITTLHHDGQCDFLYSVFRMGQGAVVDNFHAGGIAASVNVKTGIVETPATDLNGNTYEIHPVSGLPIVGFQIPHWDKILSICCKACTLVDKVNLVGWDFAITEDGPELVEGNSEASYVVAQLPNVFIKKGLRNVMVDPYL